MMDADEREDALSNAFLGQSSANYTPGSLFSSASNNDAAGTNNKSWLEEDAILQQLLTS